MKVAIRVVLITLWLMGVWIIWEFTDSQEIAAQYALENAFQRRGNNHEAKFNLRDGNQTRLHA